MIVTDRKPVPPGEMLAEEFMVPLGLTQTELARLMGVERRLVNEICVGKRAITADTALMLARVLGTSAEFWLNTQRRTDLWLALNDAKRRARIDRPLDPHTPGSSSRRRHSAARRAKRKVSALRRAGAIFAEACNGRRSAAS